MKTYKNLWDDFISIENFELAVKKAVKINQKIKNVNSENPKEAVAEIDELMTGAKAFNPKKKIVDYIAATGDNGFNLDEVLNPGELELEDLCKELGLMQEK